MKRPGFSQHDVRFERPTTLGAAQLSARPPRLWGLDALRGLAVLAMVTYHFLWDLSFFGLYPADVTRGAWYVAVRAGASLFLLLVGISLNLAAQRHPPPACDRLWRRRGVKVWGWALLITLITRIGLGERFILFGILHLIGTALLLAPVLWRWRDRSGPIGLALLAAGVAARRLPVDGPWLIPLGLFPATYASVDYYPILPWLGMVAIGLWLGRQLRLAEPRPWPGTRPPPWLRPLCLMGRHALPIYLAHQPVLLVGFWLAGFSVF